MNQVNLSQRIKQGLMAVIFAAGTIWTSTPITRSAQAFPTSYNENCQSSPQENAEKQRLRVAMLKGDPTEYNNLVKRQAQMLTECRSKSWLQTQAIWLRLYPCDSREGSIEEILDRIASRGYNEVYLEVFYSGQVLLPKKDNRTVWPSILDRPGTLERDLLAETIKKGHQRGLKVYAWMFSLNYGYIYGQMADRQTVFARNGKGENSLSFVSDQSQLFIDPYNETARQDYLQLLRLVLQRRPDGVLFDYIRYPKGSGDQSAVGDVKDLWIYGGASKSVLLSRAKNNKGRFLIEQFLNQGYISPNDLQEADKRYPLETSPLWQGRTPPPDEMLEPLNIRYDRIRLEIWYLAVAHAAQGVIDFLTLVTDQVRQQGIPAGAAFFPDGNQSVGQRGFDSRLQPWDRFPSTIEWHPMSYALCDDPQCVVRQVKKVLSTSQTQTEVVPAIAGFWGKSYENRPSLEIQMAALRSNFPQLKSISHFAFSWQEPEFDKERRFCKDS